MRRSFRNTQPLRRAKAAHGFAGLAQPGVAGDVPKLDSLTPEVPEGEGGLEVTPEGLAALERAEIAEGSSDA